MLKQMSFKWSVSGAVFGCLIGLSAVIMHSYLTIPVRVINSEVEPYILEETGRWESYYDPLLGRPDISPDGAYEKIALQLLDLSDHEGAAEIIAKIASEPLRKRLCGATIARRVLGSVTIGSLPDSFLTCPDGIDDHLLFNAIFSICTTSETSIVSLKNTTFLADRISDSRIKAYALSHIAQVHADLGQRDEAITLLRQAANIDQKDQLESVPRHDINSMGKEKTKIMSASTGPQNSKTEDILTIRSSSAKEIRASDSSSTNWDFRIPAIFSALGFLIAGILKPILEAVGKAFIGKPIAEALRNEDFATAIGGSVSKTATAQSSTKESPSDCSKSIS
jgi:hypothetical protein